MHRNLWAINNNSCSFVFSFGKGPYASAISRQTKQATEREPHEKWSLFLRHHLFQMLLRVHIAMYGGADGR